MSGFVQSIERVLLEQPHDMVLPGTDASLLAVSRHRGQLGRHTALALPSEGAVEAVLNRERLGAAAKTVGLAPPESVLCDRLDDARRAAERFGYPVLVKPEHTVLERLGAIERHASALVQDEGELAVAVRTFGSCLVQRRAQGSVLSFGGVADREGLVAFAVSRYERTWPARAGNVCFSRTIEPPSGLEHRVAALVAEMGWVGLFEVELIEDGDRGLAAIDFNPRAYGSMSLAIAAGVPLPALWCDAVLGERDGRRPQARAGVGYRWAEADLCNVAWQLRRGLGVAAMRSLRPRHGVVHPFFQCTDPAPAAARALALLPRAWNSARAQRSPGATRVSFGSEVPPRSSAR